jgi:hypothetical protein
LIILFGFSIERKGKKQIKGVSTPVGKPPGRRSESSKGGGNLSDANTSGKETDSRSSTPSLQGTLSKVVHMMPLSDYLSFLEISQDQCYEK